MSIERSFTAAVGVETGQQYREVASWDYSRRLGEVALGVLMSEKTGLLGAPNRHGSIYPNFEDTEGIFEVSNSFEAKRLPLIVHYNTDNPDKVGDQLVRALAPHKNVDGVQVNGLRIQHLGNLAHLKEQMPDISLIMQIDDEYLGELKPSDLKDLLRAHDGLLDYLWLDASGGNGRLLDVRRLLPYIETTLEEGASVGIAGGLNAANVKNQLITLVEQYPDVSWDAESGVQDRAGNVRRFDTVAARDFLTASLDLRSRIYGD